MTTKRLKDKFCELPRVGPIGLSNLESVLALEDPTVLQPTKGGDAAFIRGLLTHTPILSNRDVPDELHLNVHEGGHVAGTYMELLRQFNSLAKVATIYEGIYNERFPTPQADYEI